MGSLSQNSILQTLRGGGGGGNFGTVVRTSFLKPTLIIYLVLQKIDLFIYLIGQNVSYSFTVL